MCGEAGGDQAPRRLRRRNSTVEEPNRASELKRMSLHRHLSHRSFISSQALMLEAATDALATKRLLSTPETSQQQPKQHQQQQKQRQRTSGSTGRTIFLQTVVGGLLLCSVALVSVLMTFSISGCLGACWNAVSAVLWVKLWRQSSRLERLLPLQHKIRTLRQLIHTFQWKNDDLQNDNRTLAQRLAEATEEQPQHGKLKQKRNGSGVDNNNDGSSSRRSDLTVFVSGEAMILAQIFEVLMDAGRRRRDLVSKYTVSTTLVKTLVERLERIEGVKVLETNLQHVLASFDCCGFHGEEDDDNTVDEMFALPPRAVTALIQNVAESISTNSNDTIKPIIRIVAVQNAEPKTLSCGSGEYLEDTMELTDEEVSSSDTKSEPPVVDLSPLAWKMQSSVSLSSPSSSPTSSSSSTQALTSMSSFHSTNTTFSNL